MSLKTLLIFILLLSASPLLYAQRYLLLDNYGLKRIRIYEGSTVYFKLEGHQAVYMDQIALLTDSTVLLASMKEPIPLPVFTAFYFPRQQWRALTSGATYVGCGFLFSALAGKVIKQVGYDPGEHAILGVSFLALSRVFKLMKWKKFRINSRHRVRIIDSSFR